MEGLAAAGGVIAVASLAGQVVQGCHYLCNILDGAKTAPEDVRSLAAELKIIETIVSTTPQIGQYSDVLDFCNEKVSKLRNVVEKYGVLDVSSQQRRWGTRLSMALNAEKIRKFLASLREAKRHLEHIENVSAHAVSLCKTDEVLGSVQQLNASHSGSAQILCRTERKVDNVEQITQQTQQALQSLTCDLYKKQETCATVRDVHTIMNMLQSVEITLREHLPQSQLKITPASDLSTVQKSVLLPIKATRENHNSIAQRSNLLAGSTTENPYRSSSVHVNRIVDIAITARYRRGKVFVNAVAVTDRGFEEADFDTKTRMVKLLQDLRLLMWLLTHNTNFRSCYRARTRGLHTRPMSRAGICRTWNYSEWGVLAQRNELHSQPMKELSRFIAYAVKRSRYHEDKENHGSTMSNQEVPFTRDDFKITLITRLMAITATIPDCGIEIQIIMKLLDVYLNMLKVGEIWLFPAYTIQAHLSGFIDLSPDIVGETLTAVEIDGKLGMDFIQKGILLSIGRYLRLVTHAAYWYVFEEGPLSRFRKKAR